MTPRSITADNICCNSPRIIIQCDWNIVLREPAGKAWITCQEIGQNGKHGSLNSQISLRNEPLTHNKISPTEGFQILGYNRRWIKVTHQDPNCSYTFLAPDKIFSDIHKHSISSISVSDGGLGVSACTDKKLRIWDAESGTIRRELEGHLGDVYSAKFFPSGLVILSGGSDMQLKIWSAENGQCPVTLKGHKAAITGVNIVERGRNVVSCSKDGTACLWDCGQESTLHVYKPNGEVDHEAFCIRLNCCAIQSVDLSLDEPIQQQSEREVMTEGKLLILGDEAGKIKGFGLRNKREVFDYNCNSAVNCCAFLNKDEIICGTQDGNILILKLIQHESTVLCNINLQFKDSNSAVLSLLTFREGFFASRADGSCTYYATNNDCRIELTGSDFDPIYCVAKNSQSIFTACRDNKIRVYNITASPF